MRVKGSMDYGSGLLFQVLNLVGFGPQYFFLRQRGSRNVGSQYTFFQDPTVHYFSIEHFTIYLVLFYPQNDFLLFKLTKSLKI